MSLEQVLENLDIKFYKHYKNQKYYQLVGYIQEESTGTEELEYYSFEDGTKRFEKVNISEVLTKHKEIHVVTKMIIDSPIYNPIQEN